MTRRESGHYTRTAVGGEAVDAFVPDPLPPSNPPLATSPEAAALLASAEESLRALDLASGLLPSLDGFIHGFVRKEAVVSSQIEGTQATLIDLLAFEGQGGSTGAPEPDVREVCNYIDALEYARAELTSEHGLPLSMRLLGEAHARLMQGGRGEGKQPGEVRSSQNWLGGTRPGNAAFVPPPPNELPALLTALERYLHAEDSLPKLVRAGLIHVQFETIHPYLDGNGRIGRLLVALLLEHWGLLSQPLLYVSLFFKRHRAEYYRRLSAVRTEGDWEGWTLYFLEAIDTIAREALESLRAIASLVSEDRGRVLSVDGSSIMAARLFEQLLHRPFITINHAAEILDTTRPTAAKAVDVLVGVGVLEETTGKKRGRAFGYSSYLTLLRVGTDL